ncbi:unnamed protein product [Parajaminaea phylloscopi]
MARKEKLGANPVEAARKAARQRESKRNKAAREQTREFGLVRKDTGHLEEELRHVERRGGDTTALKEELEKIKRVKDKYLDAHPEHRKLVFKEEDRPQPGPSGAAIVPLQNRTGLFRPDGKPWHPERSIYYDPTFNPWGNPPPGMPYRERPPHEWPANMSIVAPRGPSLATQQQTLAESDSDSDDDSDIMMPQGPPPGLSTQATGSASDEDSEDDDIVMPAGPPPSQQLHGSGFAAPVPPPPGGYTGPPPGMPHSGVGRSVPVRFPPPPPGFGFHIPHQPANGQPPFPLHGQGRYPPQYAPPQNRPPPNAPRGPAPRQRPPPPVGAPVQPAVGQQARPSPAVTTGAAASDPAKKSSGATISSAPVLRDFKKEATTFLPASIRRQQALAQRKSKAAGLGSRVIRANPVVADVDEDAPNAISGEAPESGPHGPSSHLQLRTDDIDRSGPAEPLRSDDDERQDPAARYAAPEADAASPSSQVLFSPNTEVTPSTPAVHTAPDGKDKAATAGGGGLLSYYSDSDAEDDEEEEEGSSNAVEPSSKGKVFPTTSAAAPQGRVNLVAALSNVPWAQAQPKKAAASTSGGGAAEEYRRYLASVEDILGQDGQDGQEDDT